ncbi:hypothetical protein V1264_017183 [Littorina saxatilis]|uniref:Large ribosomal subunit protein bL17m n=2 Tax=Littorina saxatilis TaxID=31220 RepID=A0AAN9GEY6_9CAEN
MLRFRIRTRPRKMASLEGLGSGPEGRLKRLRKHVTALIRHERLETTYAQCDETRGYAEKLITMAVRNGDRDKHTMEMADYWLLEKDLIHKLFKVLVPRYQSLPATATSIHRISTEYPGDGRHMGVLELKGNPWPPVRPQPRNTRLHLHNIQLEEAKKEYHQERLRAKSAAAAVPPEGSSVDGPAGSSVDPDPIDSESESGESKNSGDSSKR